MQETVKQSSVWWTDAKWPSSMAHGPVLYCYITKGDYQVLPDNWTILALHTWFNSLWSSNTMWWIGSTLPQILTAPNDYRNQCLLIINKHSSDGIIMEDLKIPINKTKLKIVFLKLITSRSPRDQWVKQDPVWCITTSMGRWSQPFSRPPRSVGKIFHKGGGGGGGGAGGQKNSVRPTWWVNSLAPGKF